MNPGKHFANLSRMFRGKFERGTCLHPNAGPTECRGGIVNAHTVQRANVLETIAEAGHVYQFNFDLRSSGKKHSIHRVGVNEATTFRGFCAHHDSTLFRPLEAFPFTFTSEQLFLLGYRAICREYYAKLGSLELNKELRVYVASHMDLDDPAKDEMLRWSIVGNQHGLQAIGQIKKIFDSSLSTNSYTDYHSCTFVFDSAPVCFCSGAFAPEYDFDGNLLQDLSDLSFIQETITFSLWVADGLAIAAFVWHSSSERQCRRFIDSLKRKSPKRIANLVVSLAFEHCENTAFSQKWWNSLSPRNRNMISNRIASGLPSQHRESSCLKDDGNTTVAWHLKHTVEH